MTIPAGLAAELHLLTQALDLPGVDVAATLIRLAVDAQTAVASYLGLSVAITANRSEFDFTVLCDGAQPEDVQASLLIPLSTVAADASKSSASVALILYAGRPGAFVDLAADLAFITERTLADFRLDEHLVLPATYSEPTALTAMSTINQALGVLIGRGSTPEQAERDLSKRATTAGIGLAAAASLVLASVTPPIVAESDDD